MLHIWWNISRSGCLKIEAGCFWVASLPWCIPSEWAASLPTPMRHQSVCEIIHQGEAWRGAWGVGSGLRSAGHHILHSLVCLCAYRLSGCCFIPCISPAIWSIVAVCFSILCFSINRMRITLMLMYQAQHEHDLFTWLIVVCWSAILVGFYGILLMFCKHWCSLTFVVI